MTATKPVLRRSQFQSLLSCTSYESGPSINAALGSIVHDSIASYTLLCRQHGEETRLADVERIAHEAFFREARGIDPGRIEEALDIFDRWARTHTAELATLIAVEHTLTQDVGFALLTGTIDRLDRIDDADPDDPISAIRITDWKTSWAAEAHEFQLKTYAALVAVNYPTVKVIQTRADHFRLNDGIVEMEYERSYILHWWDSVLAGLEKRLSAPKGEPTGGPACQYCRKRLSCGYALPPWNAVPENDAQAEEVIQDWIRLEAAELETRKALQAYFIAREPMQLKGLEVGWLSARELSFAVPDVEKFKTAMTKMGLDPTPALKPVAVDTRKVPKSTKAALIEAGVAHEYEGHAEFKHRKLAAKK